MSPALIDTGASTQNPLHQDFKGQIRSPSPISSFEFSGFMSNQQIASSFDMNSRGQSGFENSSGMNPNFEFSSPAASKFGSEKPLMSSLSSLSRPRMAKSRKSLTSRAMGSSETRELDLGFNPFHPLSHNLSGVSSGLESDDDGSKHLNMKVINEVGKLGDAFIEETGKLEIEKATLSHMASQNANNLTDRSSLSGNQQHSKVVENIGQSELPDCMKKLNLGGSLGENSTISGGRWDNLGKNREASLGYSSGHNVGGFFGATLPSELPNDFEKLNRKNTGEVRGQNFVFNTTSRRDFVFSGSGKNSDPLSTGIATTLPEKIENLNIEDRDKSNGAQKDMNFNKSNKTFDSDSRATGTGSGPSGRAIDPMILDKMERLNTGDCSEGSSDHTDPGGFSSLRKGGMGITSKNAHGESNETVFPSLIPEQGKHPWSPQVSMGQSNRGVELHPAPASSKSTFQSFGLNFQPLGEESQKPCMDATEKKDSFGFSSTHDGLRLPHVEFRTPDSKCNLFAGSSQEIEFSAKGSVKYTLLKGRKGKPKESASVLIAIGKSFVPKDNSREAFSEPSESYSPMDVSPYQETEDDAQSAREPSSTSDDQTSNFSQAGLSNDAAEEDLVTAKECIDANESNDVMHDEANTGGVALEDSVSVFETQSFKSANDKLDRNGENEVESTGQGQSSDPTQYLNASSSVSSGASSFTFAASTPVPHPSASIRHQKKKNRMKAGDLYIPTRTVLTDAAALPFSPISGVSMILSPVRQQDEVPTAPQKESINVKVTSPTTTILGGSNLKDTKREVKSLATASYAAQEACEKWRLRGNQAYSCGDLEKAEDYYTQGLSCIPQNETSSNCLRALVLCYSNRAATRMSLGRMREALEDCLVAAKLDPNFLRVRLRAANCYLALGEVVDASRYFQKLLQATEVCVEHKLLQEASDGVQKAQKVSECMDCSAGLLLQRKPSDIESALRVIAEALVISPYSEQLLERRAEAVFMLGRHEEVIELCVQSLEAAEKNSPLLGANGQSSNLEAAEPLKQYYFRIWRYRLIFKSNFHLGKLEDALDFLENQEQWRSLVTKYGNDTLECLIPQLSTARELIRHKCFYCLLHNGEGC